MHDPVARRDTTNWDALVARIGQPTNDDRHWPKAAALWWAAGFIAGIAFAWALIG
jgi:hypothetical protein